MGIIVNLNENRSELQKKIATELQEKTRQKASLGDVPDGVEDSTMIEKTNQTGSLGWLKVLLVIILLSCLIALSSFIVSSQK